MIWTLYIVAVFLVPLVFLGFRSFDSGDDVFSLLGCLGGVFGSVGILMCLLVPTIVLGERVVGATTCSNWSEQTGYPAKFRVLNWADGGKCMARTPDGHWTLNTNIIINVPAKP